MNRNFLYRHRRLIAINVAITSVLAILVIALLWNDKLLKREVLNLQSETEHLEKLFENSPHGTILINPRGEIMRANRAFLRMFGYGRKDVKGKDVDSLLAKAGDLLRHAQDLTIITGLGGVVSGRESLRLRKDGSLLPVMISGYPLVTKGMYRGSYGIYTDISARKNNEGAIRQHLRAEEIISSLSAALVKEKDFEQTILSSLHDLRLFSIDICPFSSLTGQIKEEEQLLFVMKEKRMAGRFSPYLWKLNLLDERSSLRPCF